MRLAPACGGWASGAADHADALRRVAVERGPVVAAVRDAGHRFDAEVAVVTGDVAGKRGLRRFDADAVARVVAGAVVAKQRAHRRFDATDVVAAGAEHDDAVAPAAG